MGGREERTEVCSEKTGPAAGAEAGQEYCCRMMSFQPWSMVERLSPKWMFDKVVHRVAGSRLGAKVHPDFVRRYLCVSTV
jgi:hypothetical protein